MRREKLPFLYCCLFFSQLLFGQASDLGIRGSENQSVDNVSDIYTDHPDDSTMSLDSIPLEVRATRESQMEAALTQGVELVFHDAGVISETAIQGVPLNLTGIPIDGDDRIAALVETLYPLFGFDGSEGLQLSGPAGNGYSLHQTIHGIPVDSKVIQVVLRDDRTIVAIRGSAILNRGFSTDHALDADAALERVNLYLEEQGLSPLRGNPQQDRVELVYKHWDGGRTLAPWWLVEKTGHAGYFVDPDGVVSSAVVVTP